MAKQLHEITPAEFENGLDAQFPRGMEKPEEKLPRQRWARVSELNHELWTHRPGKFFLGYRGGKQVGREDDRHLILVAGSRAGKSVSVLLPNLLLWPGSLLAIDPKGELAAKTAAHRSATQRVIVLDPFNASNRNSEDGFNPLEEIDLEAEDAGDQAGLIADGLIIHEGGDRHWTDAAKQLVHAVLLYVLLIRPEKERHLGVVRDFLTLAHPAAAPQPPREGEPKPPADQGLYEALADCRNEQRPDLAALVAGVGKSMLGVPDKERGSIRSSAVTQTAFLESYPLGITLHRSSFRLRDLKRGIDGKQVTVYLCLPASYMGTHGRWLRIIINMALAAMEDTRIEPPRPPVLMVLEEMGSALGYMATLEKAAGLIAGYGVRLLTVLQDLTQLQHHYPKTWETFIGNAGLFLAFGNSDATTLKYVSEKLGTLAIPVTSQSDQTASSTLAGSTGVSTSMLTVPLLAPHEVEAAFTRERGRMLVMFPGMKPIVVQRTISHEDTAFKGQMGS